MVDRLYLLVNEAFIVSVGVMGICFLAFPTPQNKEIKNYRISLKVLSGAYFLMAALMFSVLFFNLNDNSKEPLTFINLLLSSSQALLFTFTLITLFNPKFVTQRYILWQLLPIIILILLYAISVLIFGDPFVHSFTKFVGLLSHPTVFIRSLFTLFYLFQLLFYTLLFFREEKKYKESLNNYFSDVIRLKLHWVRYAYIAAFFCGTLSMIANFFPSQLLDICFTIIYSTFYLFFAIEYIKYPNIYKFIQPAIGAFDAEENLLSQTRHNHKWAYYKKIVLEKRYYLNPGITIEEIAQKLNISRLILSKFINSEENKNFNSWINSMRIADSQQLMTENPDLSILQVSEQMGYSEQTNFSRQFKLITGDSPTEWRQKNLFETKN
jgi:AraC-like DNA-binding protein